MRSGWDLFREGGFQLEAFLWFDLWSRPFAGKLKMKSSPLPVALLPRSLTVFEYMWHRKGGLFRNVSCMEEMARTCSLLHSARRRMGVGVGVAFSSLYSTEYENKSYFFFLISFLKSSSSQLFYGKGSRIWRFSASSSIHISNSFLPVTNTYFPLQPKRGSRFQSC